MVAGSAVPPRIIRPGVPRTRVTFQLAVECFSAIGGANVSLGPELIAEVVGWLGEKFAAPLPSEAAGGASFSADVPGQSLRAIAVPEDGLWVARLVQPDAPYLEQAAVAGRTWSTEISLRRIEDRILLGIRVVCASLPYATDEIRLTRPRLVADLAQRFSLRDVRPIVAEPWRLQTRDDLEALRAFITDSRRRLPLCLLTQPDQGRLGLETEEFLLDADALSRRAVGMLHVATMPMSLGYEWTEMVGKPWSAYLGAVRTYRPGLSFESDSPIFHPRILAEGVLAFQYKDLTAEAAFTEFLVDQAHKHVATMLIDWGQLRFLQDAEIRRAELARLEATDDETRAELLEAEVGALKAKLVVIEEERDVALGLGESAERALERIEGDNRRIRAQLDVLRAAFEQKTGTSPDALVSMPKRLSEVSDWVEEHLAGRLVLHPRALRGLKDGHYADVGLLGRALLVLANEYRDRERGIRGAHDGFDAACKALELRYGRSIARERAGEEGETYFVRFPVNAEQLSFLEWHLRKGSGKDQRFCLAIYFYWDQPTQQVVVGWLPSHLDNRMT